MGPQTFFYDFIYFFLKRKEGREKEMERNIDQLTFTHPQLGTWPSTQACTLIRNQISDLLVCRLALNPLGHLGHGRPQTFF